MMDRNATSSEMRGSASMLESATISDSFSHAEDYDTQLSYDDGAQRKHRLK